MKEVPAMDKMFDLQNYVESGIKITKIKQKESCNNMSYIVTKDIATNNSGSCFFLKQNWEQQQDTSDSHLNEELMRNEENHGPYLGGYKHYCLLDFYEIERIENLLDNRSPIDKIDMNTIFSCIRGQSIFTYFEGEIRLLKTISA